MLFFADLIADYLPQTIVELVFGRAPLLLPWFILSARNMSVAANPF